MVRDEMSELFPFKVHPLLHPFVHLTILSVLLARPLIPSNTPTFPFLLLLFLLLLLLLLLLLSLPSLLPLPLLLPLPSIRKITVFFMELMSAVLTPMVLCFSLPLRYHIHQPNIAAHVTHPHHTHAVITLTYQAPLSRIFIAHPYHMLLSSIFIAHPYHMLLSRTHIKHHYQAPLSHTLITHNTPLSHPLIAPYQHRMCPLDPP